MGGNEAAGFSSKKGEPRGGSPELHQLQNISCELTLVAAAAATVLLTVLAAATATLAATLLATLLLIFRTTPSLLAALLTALILFLHFSPSLLEPNYWFSLPVSKKPHYKDRWTLSRQDSVRPVMIAIQMPKHELQRWSYWIFKNCGNASAARPIARARLSFARLCANTLLM